MRKETGNESHKETESLDTSDEFADESEFICNIPSSVEDCVGLKISGGGTTMKKLFI